MFAYCTEELRLSEDAAYKRIRASRAARRFPLLFREMAEGRLHMAAVCALSPHLTSENLEELTRAASHRRKAEVEEWLIHRFPGAAVASKECAPVIRPLDISRMRTDFMDQLVLGPVPCGSKAAPEHASTGSSVEQRVQGPVVTAHAEQPASDTPPNEPAPYQPEGQLVPGPVAGGEAAALRKRYLVRLTIDEATHEKLLRVQAMLSHAVPDGNLAKVLDRALDALLVQLEKRKIGAATRVRNTGDADGAPTTSARPSRSPSKRHNGPTRHIPVGVRRAVWERDEGRCTFIGTSGHRCDARRFLEFDHVEPLARGGKATVAGLRLRCRSHNQLEAERVYGAEFMRRKREHARLAAINGRPEIVREPSGLWIINSADSGRARLSQYGTLTC